MSRAVKDGVAPATQIVRLRRRRDPGKQEREVWLQQQSEMHRGKAAVAAASLAHGGFPVVTHPSCWVWISLSLTLLISHTYNPNMG